jgi:hypothetical protein
VPAPHNFTEHRTVVERIFNWWQVVIRGADSVKTLKASLLASAIGTGAWMLGLTRAMWPAHPQLAVFFLTLGATAILMYVWPEPQK